MASQGSRPYLTLAEVGYLVQVAFVLASLLVLAVTLDSNYAMSPPATLVEVLVEVLLVLVLSVSWFQLGRNEGNPWFLAAGVLGALASVLSLTQPLTHWEYQPSLSFFVLVPLASIVSLIYFVAQLLAYNSAAEVFRVKIFRYAAYTLAAEFVLSSVGGAAVAALTAMEGQSSSCCSQQDVASAVVFGLGYIFSGATSMIAGIGFHRLRGPRNSVVASPATPL